MATIPNWEDYFLFLAFVASQRSKDAETKHGCVITNKKNIVLGTGYNSFPRGLKDEILPNKRPGKYPWMVHSERNAVTNCTLKPEDGTAYVTGECCNDCLMHLWQNGVTDIVYADREGTKLANEETRKVYDDFLDMTKGRLRLKKVVPDFSWIVTLANSLPKEWFYSKTIEIW